MYTDAVVTSSRPVVQVVQVQELLDLFHMPVELALLLPIVMPAAVAQVDMLALVVAL